MDIEEIESILCCPICIEMLDDPRILPCQHSFCEECLSSFIKDRTKNIRVDVKSFPCPVCRRETKLKNICSDATAFPKDLTKIALLESKDTLLKPHDDNLVESNTCETQTMTTNTDAFDENVNDSLMKSEAQRNAARRAISKKRKRQKSSKCSVHPAVVTQVTYKADGEGTRRKVSKKGRKLRGKQGISRQDINNDKGKIGGQEIWDILVVEPLDILYKNSFKRSEKACAIVLVLFLCIIYTVCLYITPYLSALMSCFVFYLYRCEGSKLMSSYCSENGRKVTKFDMILFHALQFSAVGLIFICFICVVVTLSAFKNTITNALWKTGSIVSIQELEANLELWFTHWFFVLRIINFKIKQIVVFILWL